MSTGPTTPGLAAVWTWGDPGLVVAALEPQGARTFVVCGRGDSPMLVLAAGPSALRVCEPRAEARALFALKLAAAWTLPRPTLRSLFGMDEAGRRIFLYHYVREGRQEGRGPPPPGLAGEARAFWDAREPLIREGLASGGERERREALVRRLVGSVSGGRPPGGRRLRLLAQAALSPRLGLQRAQGLASRLDALARRRSPLALRLLEGPSALPDLSPWMQEQALVQIARRPPVELDPLPPALALARLPAGSLDAVHLGLEVEAASLQAAAQALAPGGRLLLRSASPPPTTAGLVLDAQRSRELQAQDQALLLERPWLLRRR